MKQVKMFVLLLSMAILLVACASQALPSGNTPAPAPSSAPSEAVQAGQPESAQPSEAPTETGSVPQQSEDLSQPASTDKTLVVYYSATGSTKAVAETIARQTGGDLFSIEPAESYSSDDLNWRDKTAAAHGSMTIPLCG